MSEDHDVEPLEEACPICEKLINVTAEATFSKVSCPHCGAVVRVRPYFNEFTIQGEVGAGGMSRVFLAMDDSLDREVALKILHPQFSRQAERVKQFEKEAKMSASISHANVVKVFTSGSDQGQLYIAMELVRGGTLDEKIRAQGSLVEEEVLSIGVAVAQGLRAAYKGGLIHRDIKPGNILFKADGTPKIVDFGLALIAEKDIDDSGEIWATPYYVPPEKLSGQPDDLRGDIYSLGASLFHALAARPPYPSESSSIEELRKIKSVPVKLEDVGGGFSIPTCRVINRMISVDPAGRQQDYDQLVRELELAHESVTRAAAGDDEAAAAAAKQAAIVAGEHIRKRNMMIAGGIAAVLIGILALAFSGGGDDDDDGGEDPNITVVPTPGGGGGGPSVSELFLGARGELVEGNYRAAVQAFDVVIDRPTVPQEVAAWAKFNGALGATLLGSAGKAAGYYRQLSEVAAVGEGFEVGHVNFLQAASRLMLSEHPPAPDAAESFPDGEVAPLRHLLVGAKAAEFGDFGLAAKAFRSYIAEAPDPEESWVGAYAPVASQQLEGLRAVAAAPGAGQELPIDACQELAETLKTTAASLPAYSHPKIAVELEERSTWYLDRIKGLEAAAARQAAMQLEELRMGELDELSSLVRSLGGYADGYRFDGALAALDALEVESPEVLAARDDHRHLWAMASEFFEQLIEDLNTIGYNGAISRVEGPPLLAEILGADRAGLRLKLDYGETLLPLEEVPARWMVATAWQIADRTAESPEHYHRCECIAAFARVVVLEDYAESVTDYIMSQNTEIRDRWQRILETVDG